MEGCFRHIMYKYKNGNFDFFISLFTCKKIKLGGGTNLNCEIKSCNYIFVLFTVKMLQLKKKVFFLLLLFSIHNFLR